MLSSNNRTESTVATELVLEPVDDPVALFGICEEDDDVLVPLAALLLVVALAVAVEVAEALLLDLAGWQTAGRLVGVSSQAAWAKPGYLMISISKSGASLMETEAAWYSLFRVLLI